MRFAYMPKLSVIIFAAVLLAGEALIWNSACGLFNTKYSIQQYHTIDHRGGLSDNGSANWP